MAFPTESLKRICRVAATAALALLVFAPVAKAEEDVWPSLKQSIFGDRAIAEDGIVVLEAPDSALDAAVVPIKARVGSSVTQDLKSMTLIIDKNPIPLVAKIKFGPAAGTGGERSFETRVRIDKISNVRAIVELADGTLHMAAQTVLAAGGCAAMQAKDADADKEGLGQMIVKILPPPPGETPLLQAQILIKHPNSNGMQLDINTAEFIPARFVKDVTVKRAGELVLQMESTFSISTNPNFRFTFGKGGDNSLDVAVTDTDGAVFTARSEPSGS
jgi:sulfur-oxidizing protein SoxY